MASLQQAAQCMGISGNFSVLTDFFGLSTGTIPKVAGAPSSISLLRQLRLLNGPHFHLNVIRVGVEQFLIAQDLFLDTALLVLRNVYAPGNLGVGRVQHFGIPDALTGGKQFIAEDDDSEDLTEEWTVHNFAIDLFVVQSLPAAPDNPKFQELGMSPRPGSCSKDDQGRTGSVIRIVPDGFDKFGGAAPGGVGTGILIAHELGHYLGLKHVVTDDTDAAGVWISNPAIAAALAQSTTNLMFPILWAANETLLSAGQFDQMKEHCFVVVGCVPPF